MRFLIVTFLIALAFIFILGPLLMRLWGIG
jgi:hypothetical protein